MDGIKLVLTVTNGRREAVAEAVIDRLWLGDDEYVNLAFDAAVAAMKEALKAEGVLP
ncbi:hypothetical protein PBI_ACHEBE_42 [Mycobacterium phage Achebe]|uniref:Uncharacterized protein n=1 Tax=Mycobacterium phage Backyardigan TaxID=2902881 RepID=G1BL15_9CAUD|nr:hypothetical protein WILE_43 [Mycobacterium phage Wile]YP_009635455.1 hypothetical protein FGG52_gp42 [Mycobacterium phage Backyardigan]AOT27550.1 hypothetical protein SEA_BADGER_42 [Mycobacterium phage Badger]APD17391.1 hypothetical protein PBI_ACHEBE_42 [Mycobacterium phage Achebe]ASZ73676.1 hypothetical protein SEA_MORPHER26_43 [Mycobacterium phage Morpher26]AZS11655.1 hypothetical protein SEA_CICI_43 [Mycobacterium phage Cici]QAY05373.1 hypothetical protein SEA_KATALIE136_43 [Mycobacte